MRAAGRDRPGSPSAAASAAAIPHNKARAEAVFAHQAQPRQAVVESYRPALQDEGRSPRPARRCFKKLVHLVPPRWATTASRSARTSPALNDKSPESLLIAILDPNRAFETKYVAFSVATVDGRVLSGLIASESATAVTLRRQDGKDDVLLRSDIEEMSASGQSLMPEGLEKDLKPHDLADLISFLRLRGGPPAKPE